MTRISGRYRFFICIPEGLSQRKNTRSTSSLEFCANMKYVEYSGKTENAGPQHQNNGFCTMLLLCKDCANGGAIVATFFSKILGTNSLSSKNCSCTQMWCYENDLSNSKFFNFLGISFDVFKTNRIICLGSWFSCKNCTLNLDIFINLKNYDIKYCMKIVLIQTSFSQGANKCILKK